MFAQAFGLEACKASLLFLETQPIHSLAVCLMHFAFDFLHDPTIGNTSINGAGNRGHHSEEQGSFSHRAYWCSGSNSGGLSTTPDLTLRSRSWPIRAS
jgi:hypothetical protein